MSKHYTINTCEQLNHICIKVDVGCICDHTPMYCVCRKMRWICMECCNWDKCIEDWQERQKAREMQSEILELKCEIMSLNKWIDDHEVPCIQYLNR